MNQAGKYRQQYSALLSAFNSHHPDIAPPDPTWFRMWIERYEAEDIENAVAAAPRNLNAEATGKAISAALRKQALDRAVPEASNE